MLAQVALRHAPSPAKIGEPLSLSTHRPAVAGKMGKQISSKMGALHINPPLHKKSGGCTKSRGEVTERKIDCLSRESAMLP